MTGIISVRQEIDSPKDSTPEDDQVDTKQERRPMVRGFIASDNGSDDDEEMRYLNSRREQFKKAPPMLLKTFSNVNIDDKPLHMTAKTPNKRDKRRLRGDLDHKSDNADDIPICSSFVLDTDHIQGPQSDDDEPRTNPAHDCASKF